MAGDLLELDYYSIQYTSRNVFINFKLQIMQIGFRVVKLDKYTLLVVSHWSINTIRLN